MPGGWPVTGAASGAAHCRINIIASHPQDDDDLACADYIRSIVLDLNTVRLAEVQQRIQNSHPAGKFLDPAQPGFKAQDIPFCTREVAGNFVMQVDASLALPTIVRRAALG